MKGRIRTSTRQDNDRIRTSNRIHERQDTPSKRQDIHFKEMDERQDTIPKEAGHSLQSDS